MDFQLTSKMKNQRQTFYLVAPVADRIKLNKLPTNKQVFAHFLYKHRTCGLPLRPCYGATAELVLNFWKQTEISVMPKRNAIRKLEKLFKDWERLLKLKSRTTLKEINKRNLFSSTLNRLFDLSIHNAHLDEKAMAFLLDQRTKRTMNIGFWKKHKTADVKPCHSTPSFIMSESESSEDDDINSSKSDNDYKVKIPSKPKTKVPKSTLMAMDRWNISDRAGVHFIAATADGLGHDVNQISLSQSGLGRARKKCRESLAKEEKSNFQVSKPLIVHFDGKMLADLKGEERIERLAIIVSGEGVEQLLAVPKLKNSSGKLCAEAIYRALAEWNIVDQVRGLSFDTTAANTGKDNGACVLLEKLIGRRLLSFACRHHIYEIVLGEVFTLTMGSSTSPTIPLFKRFKENWSNIDTNTYRTVNSDSTLAQYMTNSVKARILNFARNRIEQRQPREDYRELLNLTIVFLGGKLKDGPSFRKPAGIHRARWMSRVIYGFKILMLGRTTKSRGCFLLTKTEEAGLFNFIQFAVLGGYIEAWISSMDPAQAPYNDIQFLKSVKSFEQINKTLSAAALKKFLGHLWFLSEELIGLSFFDQRISAKEKKRMVAALKRNSSENEAPKRRSLEPQKITRNLCVSQFVTAKTLNFFTSLNLSTSFLSKNPSSWNKNEDFLTADQTIKAIRVVNDTAERGVALAEEFSQKLTKDDDQYQFILQTVAKHRKEFPRHTKSSIVLGLANKQ